MIYHFSDLNSHLSEKILCHTSVAVGCSRKRIWEIAISLFSADTLSISKKVAIKDLLISKQSIRKFAEMQDERCRKSINNWKEWKLNLQTVKEIEGVTSIACVTRSWPSWRAQIDKYYTCFHNLAHVCRPTTVLGQASIIRLTALQ